jgi:hypothetical protein
MGERKEEKYIRERGRKRKKEERKGEKWGQAGDNEEKRRGERKK